MWNENDIVLSALNKKDTGDRYPMICPNCGETGIHVYYHRFDDDDKYGAGWIWCSKCRSYAHVRCQIPSWWKNLEIIDEELLESTPDYLEGFSEDIDNLYKTHE
ncbi:MAG: hypothetical protein K5750_08885 [Eubacterium sp.]|nr:hypothetical protein [Eubacterium sp.]